MVRKRFSSSDRPEQDLILGSGTYKNDKIDRKDISRNHIISIYMIWRHSIKAGF